MFNFAERIFGERIAALEAGGGGLVGYLALPRPPDFQFVEMVWGALDVQYLLPYTLSVPAGEGDLLVEAVFNLQIYGASVVGATHGQLALAIKDTTEEINWTEDNRSNYSLIQGDERLDACLHTAGYVIPRDGAARELQVLFSAALLDNTGSALPNGDVADALNGSSLIQNGLLRAWRVPTDLAA